MFSYRHGFHAGNHADALKHVVLVQVLAHLLQKEKPFWVIDTHAGSGLYDLQSNYAAKSGESQEGIVALWPTRKDSNTPAAVSAWLKQVARCNEGDALRWYPGSPQLAAQMLRQGDHLRLFELHPTEIGLLRSHFGDVQRGVSIEFADGFEGLQACLPPPPRRGLVHIDPPYEIKQDYRRVLQALEDSCMRFATGTYMVWYPLVARAESQQFPAQLKRLAARVSPGAWLQATLRVKAAAPDGKGLFGSGVMVLNPPWTLHERLEAALPWMCERLACDEYASYTLESEQS